MFKFIKGIDKQDNTEVNKCHDTYNDINLAGAKQVEQNIQDVIDEWWSNNNLTEEQRVHKEELFPNGKPSANEFLITIVEHIRKNPQFQKEQEEIKKKEHRRQTFKDMLFVVFIFLLMLLMAIHIFIMEKNNAKKGSQTETSTSMQDYWW